MTYFIVTIITERTNNWLSKENKWFTFNRI